MTTSSAHNAPLRPARLPCAAILALVVMHACGDGATEPPPPDPPRPTTVTVSPATARLTALGATAQLGAEVRDQNGSVMAGATVNWSSNAAAVAAVDGSGLVTAAGNGTATIAATAGSASGSAAVTVAQEVSAVAVSPAVDTLVAWGDTVRLTAEASDASGHAVEGAQFSWSSSDGSVASVDASGLVTAAGNGTAEITAISGSAAGSAAVTVAQEVSTVAVSPAVDTLVAWGDTVRLTAEASDASGHAVEGAQFSWSSSDGSVASVDASGLVTAAGNGTAEITAISGSAAGSAAVTVAQEVAAVAVTPAAATLVAWGDTVRLTAEASDASGHAVEGAQFSWSSSDGSVASVDGSGLVTAAGNGTAEITAISGSAAGGAAVTVAQEVAAVAVTPAAATLVAWGDTVRLTAEASDASGHAVEGAQFSWSSSDGSVASVDGSGLVTAAGNGTAEITAISGSAAGGAAVTVAQEVAAVAVTPAAATLVAWGDTVRLTAEASDASGHAVEGAQFSWSSSDGSVASVDGSGLVTAAGNGTAEITAISGSAAGSAAVTVAQEVAAVTVSPAAHTVVAGDTLRLAAEATDANGHAVEGAEFTWSSSDHAIATVDGSG